MRHMKPLRRKPTDAELGILRVLWARGPSTVRQIAEQMGREAGYTTVLKLLQIMTEKRLVARDESARTHIYEAAYTQDQTERQLVTDLLDRVFDGSAAKLVLQALASNKASPEELDEIKKLIATKTGGHR
jgi:BlaI family transcriptional regulator, penicillinase repressor